MRRFLAIALAAVAAAVMLTACGGGNANQKFVNQVNAAQADYTTAMNKTAGKITQSSSVAVDKTVLVAEAHNYQDLSDSLGAVKAPKPLADAFSQYVGSVNKMHDVLLAAATGDDSNFLANFEQARSDEHRARLALNNAINSK